MPAETRPPPDPPLRLLRCNVCGGAFVCTLGDVVQYVTAAWPTCCGYAMRCFVEEDVPALVGMEVAAEVDYCYEASPQPRA
jgi:hypothetical protein